MSFTNTNDRLTGRKPALFPAGGEVVAQRDTIAMVAADLDINDAGAVTILPAGCELVGIIYDSDDLDTNASATITASVGVMNDTDTDLATVLASGVNASRDGTAVQLVTPAMLRLAAASVDRLIGIKFTAAAATKAAGTVGLTLLYRAA
jgi:dihydroxyacetone kinase